MPHAPSVVVYRSLIYAALAWGAAVALFVALTVIAWHDELPRVLSAWGILMSTIATVASLKYLISKASADLLDDVALLLDARGCAPGAKVQPPADERARLSAVVVD